MLGNLTSLLESEDAGVASHSYIAPHAVSLSHVGRLKDLCVLNALSTLFPRVGPTQQGSIAKDMNAPRSSQPLSGWGGRG